MKITVLALCPFCARENIVPTFPTRNGKNSVLTISFKCTHCGKNSDHWSGIIVEPLSGASPEKPQTINTQNNLAFGQAIEALKQGRRVSRSGWNGKGIYLWLLPASSVKAEWCREPHLKQKAIENGGEIECLGSIRMFTADKKVLTGWLASQTDILAEDWTILDEPEPTPTTTT